MWAQIFFVTSLRGSGSVPTILARCSEGCIGFIKALFFALVVVFAIFRSPYLCPNVPKAKNSAFMKPMQPSEHLAKIVGTEPLPRSEVTKKIWAHIKKHKLQNPKNKREILADDKLQPIFGSKKLDMFQMTKAVNKHLK